MVGMPRWLIVVVMLAAAALWWSDPQGRSAVALEDETSLVPAIAERALGPGQASFLPPQAQTTLRRILVGGPHPYAQDGTVFFNREDRLPERARGYYREYTVDTPGLGHRGARRIVAGGHPPVDWYYTDDHYDSFRRFTVASP